MITSMPPSDDIYHTIPWVCYRRRNQWLRLALPCDAVYAAACAENRLCAFLSAMPLR